MQYRERGDAPPLACTIHQREALVHGVVYHSAKGILGPVREQVEQVGPGVDDVHGPHCSCVVLIMAGKAE